jgi:hypothetical protein
MFFHLKPWQVVVYSFIWMPKHSNKKFIWWNYRFKFWFRTFRHEHLLCQKESILHKTIKRIHIIKTFWWKKIKKVKTYYLHGQKHMQPLFNVMSLAHYILFPPFWTTHHVAHFYQNKIKPCQPNSYFLN